MAPWEEIKFFDNPQTTSITAGDLSVGTGSQLIGYDPRRVVLVLSNAGTHNALFNPVTNIPQGSFAGITLAPNAPVQTFLQKDHGTLVNQAWFVGCSSAGFTTIVTAIALTVNNWPSDIQQSDFQRLLINRLARLIELLGERHASV